MAFPICMGPRTLAKYVQKSKRELGHLSVELLIFKLVFFALAIQSERVGSATTLIEALSPKMLERMRAKRAGKKTDRSKKRYSRQQIT